ncbi:MAG: twin-arginine translocase subunit TatC [Bacteroidales bacterium]|nr:twin-arginine translocase subunit TatC [Bacteroidales bacterium]
MEEKQVKDSAQMSFWDHLDELRGTLFRSIVIVFVFSIVLFCFKGFVFDGFVFGPSRSDFIFYRLLGLDFNMSLINIDLSAQFFVHMKISFILGLILGLPFVVYELWKFIAPALYENEKSAVRKSFGSAGLLFYLGNAVGYYLVLPVSLNFFQTYSVSEAVVNTISLNSYISMFTSMVLLMGVVFEFPVLIAVASRLGLITRQTLRKYRRHAICIILILSAIITPSDPFSMIVVAIPLYILFECSVIVCRKGEDEVEEEEPGEAGA